MERVHKKEYDMSIATIIEDIIYFSILFFLIAITISVVYQAIVFPDKIPDIFGIKIFIILDGNMVDSIKYGDLVFTKNIEPNTLEVDDVIAFRNALNTVTLHSILNIDKETEFDEETKENKNIQIFKMNALATETSDTKIVREDKVEGLLVYRIPKVGSVIYFIQKPIVMFVISCIILGVGAICYYIAKKLDERDMRAERIKNIKNNITNENIKNNEINENEENNGNIESVEDNESVENDENIENE